MDNLLGEYCCWGSTELEAPGQPRVESELERATVLGKPGEDEKEMFKHDYDKSNKAHTLDRRLPININSTRRQTRVGAGQIAFHAKGIGNVHIAQDVARIRAGPRSLKLDRAARDGGHRGTRDGVRVPRPVRNTAKHSVLHHAQQDDRLQRHGQGGQVEESIGMVRGTSVIANQARGHVHLDGGR